MTQAGIDEVMIERLVRRFYQQVRLDPLLGPLFATKIGAWDTHIKKLCNF
jgi:hemoglobin